jgi:hypothetical protein
MADDAPVWFTEWATVLDGEPLDKVTRERYRRSVVGYLHHLKMQRDGRRLPNGDPQGCGDLGHGQARDTARIAPFVCHARLLQNPSGVFARAKSGFRSQESEREMVPILNTEFWLLNTALAEPTKEVLQAPHAPAGGRPRHPYPPGVAGPRAS